MEDLRKELAQLDEQLSEVEYLARQVEFNDTDLEHDLDHYIMKLQETITEIQESQKWI